MVALLFLMAMPFVIAGSIGAWLLRLHLRAREARQGKTTARSAWRQGIDPMPKPVLWGSLILIIAGGVSVGTWAWLRQGSAIRLGASNAPQRLEVYGEVPTFSLVDRTGQEVTRKTLEGKVWIANFIFTSCRLTCPQQSATMAQFQADLDGEPDIRLVSVTIDPDRDTPEVLTRYAERFHADARRWLFLTGEEQAIYALAQEGFHLAAGAGPAVIPTSSERIASGGPGALTSSAARRPAEAAENDNQALVHDARFALVDRRARIRGYYSSLDPHGIERLLHDVRSLLKEER